LLLILAGLPFYRWWQRGIEKHERAESGHQS
jgi:hypothetical protein